SWSTRIASSSGKCRSWAKRALPSLSRGMGGAEMSLPPISMCLRASATMSWRTLSSALLRAIALAGHHPRLVVVGAALVPGVRCAIVVNDGVHLDGSVDDL